MGKGKKLLRAMVTVTVNVHSNPCAKLIQKSWLLTGTCSIQVNQVQFNYTITMQTRSDSEI